MDTKMCTMGTKMCTDGTRCVCAVTVSVSRARVCVRAETCMINGLNQARVKSTGAVHPEVVCGVVGVRTVPLAPERRGEPQPAGLAAAEVDGNSLVDRRCHCCALMRDTVGGGVSHLDCVCSGGRERGRSESQAVRGGSGGRAMAYDRTPSRAPHSQPRRARMGPERRGMPCEVLGHGPYPRDASGEVEPKET